MCEIPLLRNRCVGRLDGAVQHTGIALEGKDGQGRGLAMGLAMVDAACIAT